MSESKGTLLIVDDEKDIVELLTDVLTPLCTEVLTAPDGLAALNLIKSGKVDAVITDLNMPKMTGLQLLAEIRSLMYQTPVVVLTGYGDKESMLEAIRLDATDFLDKPFSQEAVIETMKKALAMGVALREMEHELEVSLQESGMSPDKLAKHKKLKRIVQGMRIQQSVYAKKT